MDEPLPTRVSLILRLRDAADAVAWRRVHRDVRTARL